MKVTTREEKSKKKKLVEMTSQMGRGEKNVGRAFGSYSKGYWVAIIWPQIHFKILFYPSPRQRNWAVIVFFMSDTIFT